VDLIVCVALVIACGLFAMQMLTARRANACRVTCLNNLKSVGIGFRLFASDGDPYPPYNPTNQAWQYFQMVGKEIGSPKVLTCPDDAAIQGSKEFPLTFDQTNGSFSDPRFQNKALSYFYGANASETNGNMLLIGDRHISISGQLTHGTLIIKSNSPVTWTKDIHKGIGNIGLADGSAQQMTTEKLRQQLANVTNETQTLVLP
jgi:hypothetical protein